MAPTTHRNRLLPLGSPVLTFDPSESVYVRLARLASGLLQAPAAVVLIHDEPGVYRDRSVGYSQEEGSLPVNMLAEALKPLRLPSGRHQVITAASAVVQTTQHPEISVFGIQALLGVGLELPDGQSGTLFVVDTQARDWTKEVAEALQEFARPLLFEVSLRHAAEEYRSRSELNAARERRFRSLIENASDIVTLLSSDGTFLYQSPSLQRLLGYAPVQPGNIGNSIVREHR